MNATNVCPECGAGVPTDAPLGLCPRCLMNAGSRETASCVPGEEPEAAASRPPAVDWTEILRTIRELDLVATEDLERLAALAGADSAHLARILVREKKLTRYQAGALLQGKARGLVIGQYLVLDKLGVGGGGVVFKAQHRPSERVVALKILPPSFGREPETVRRFRREFQIASRLSHPNLVAAIEASEDRGVHYLTMEYIPGYDLDRLVSRGGPMAIKLALHCVIQVARGLEAAHAQGVIHRDIKPGNIMIDPAGGVRVLDLGLARVIEASNQFGRTAAGSLTQTGSYMGTVDFLAPEQADNAKAADRRSDIYSLGCSLYFLLIGQPPFTGDSILKRLMAHQDRPAPSLRATRPEVSEALEEIYLKMMAKRPGDRPESMSEVVMALEACRTSSREAGDASAELKTFARTIMKRAPERRHRGPDDSVFARPSAESDDLTFDPDLRLEDIVGDYREELGRKTLIEEKLPPIVSRHLPRRVRRRRSSVPYGLLGLALVGIVAGCYAWYVSHSPTRHASTDPAQPETVDVVANPAKPAPVSTTPKPAVPQFRPLFNGRDLSGWSAEREVGAGWTVESGIIVAHGQDFRSRHFLLTDHDYADFVLRLEFNLDPGAASGICLRAVPGEQMPATDNYPYDHPLMKLIDAPGREETGTYFWLRDDAQGGMYVKPDQPAEMKPTGSWNLLEVEVRGRSMRALVNGKPILNLASAADARFPDGTVPGLNRTRGRLGLQQHTGTVRFRNIEIRDLSGTIAETPKPPEFRPLFNGRDLSGWRTHSSQPGDWRVENGILIGTSRGSSHLYTDRGDYGDYHLRLEARVNDGGNSGVYFRAPFGPTFPSDDPQWLAAYNAKIDKDRVGGLIVDGAFGRPVIRNQIPLFQPGQWTTLDVIVQGNRIEIKIDGATTSDYTDLERQYSTGHIVLQQHGRPTVAEFRKVEIKELDGMAEGQRR